MYVRSLCPYQSTYFEFEVCTYVRMIFNKNYYVVLLHYCTHNYICTYVCTCIPTFTYNLKSKVQLCAAYGVQLQPTMYNCSYNYNYVMIITTTTTTTTSTSRHIGNETFYKVQSTSANTNTNTNTNTKCYGVWH